MIKILDPKFSKSWSRDQTTLLKSPRLASHKDKAESLHPQNWGKSFIVLEDISLDKAICRWRYKIRHCSTGTERSSCRPEDWAVHCSVPWKEGYRPLHFLCVRRLIGPQGQEIRVWAWGWRAAGKSSGYDSQLTREDVICTLFPERRPG